VAARSKSPFSRRTRAGGKLDLKQMREFPSPREILKVFEKNPRRTWRLRELVIELGLRSSQARELKRALKDLARARQVVYLKKNHFALVKGDRHAALEGRPEVRTLAAAPAPRRNVATGRLIGHRDGFGFVVTDQPVGESDQDVFIPASGMGSAMHGDRVEVHVVRSREGGRLEGRITRVTERAQKTVVGEFRCGPRYNFVLPFDHRIPFEIVIPRGEEWPAEEHASRDRQFGGESEGKRAKSSAGSRKSVRELDGLIVDVEITSFRSATTLPSGRVIEVLGQRNDFGVDVEIIIRKFHLPHRFPPEALAEAEAQPQYISETEREGRRDFRGSPIVTIDGETAKDFDDAVHVERLPGGNYLLQVHIADVAHHVRPGTALDREARLRGTSVYFPDRAIPMLPLELSNGICSLNPHVDRLTMSVPLEINPEGETVAYDILPGIIRSAERMTYTSVFEVLQGDASARKRYAALVENFKLMEELALVLTRKRERRGSIDFDLPEATIEFDEFGRMTGVTRSERNMAHRIIEEFMLAANEAVAGYLERRGIPALYRIHEKPDAKKVIEFEEIAATFGYSLGVELPAARRIRYGGREAARRGERYARAIELPEVRDLKITPFHYQRLTQRLEGKPEERILSFLMLRSLKQARYSEENSGHFALAAPVYTHFTSPIRRYPDLIVHRILKAALAEGGGTARVRGDGAAERKRGRAGHRADGDDRARTRPSEFGLPGAAFVHTQELRALALETSESERRAQDAERELVEWKKVAFMAERLGDEFDALIISLTKHGFFVELTDLFIEGFVPLDSLEGDRFVYREKYRAIVGQSAKRAFRLGDRVRVRLDRIERATNRIQFSVVE
jgi:ribonuclease R